MPSTDDLNVRTFGFDAPGYGGCLVHTMREGDKIQTEIQFIKYEVVGSQSRTVKIGPKAGSSSTWHVEYAARIAISLFLNPSIEGEVKNGKVLAKSISPWQGDVTEQKAPQVAPFTFS